MADVDCVIVGAGVIGLAVARELSLAGRDCILIEHNAMIGNETSSRNSEVIHAGIYYPAGSLKAKACVAGKHLVYDYARSHHVPHNNIGKLIVATNESEAATLESIRDKALANGVDDLYYVDATRVAKLEPALRCHTALMSPSTGILDSHAYMLALQGDAEDHGTMLAFNSQFIGAEKTADGFAIRVANTAQPDEEHTLISAHTMINCAGLRAQQVANHIDAMPTEHIPEQLTVKGNYFVLATKGPFNRLIYPVPEKHGLGVHVTLDMAGGTRFGPDTEAIDSIDDYEVDSSRGDVFYAAIRKYWPDLPDGSLTPGYAGIRPKLNNDSKDFVVQGPEDHSVDGLVNCFGIESPGLTSSLYLARCVAEALG